MKQMQRALLGAAAMLLMATSASATQFTFTNITNNGNTDISGQLTVDVTAGTVAGTVDFLFKNNVGIASSVAEIYFDDGTLLGISSVTNGTGTNFTGGSANPGDLPGGNTLATPFVTTAGFLAESSGANANGINAATESVTITFTLINGKTFADTIAALEGGVDLRIGLHVRSIGTTGGSDSYVNNPGGGDPSVPDGGTTVSLLGLALAGMGIAARRFR